MRIKNIDADSDFYITCSEWKRDYIKTGKAKYFQVTSDDNVVEIHRENDKTGKLEFRSLMDSNVAKKQFTYKTKNIYIKDLSYNFYDKNLIPNTIKNHKSFNFFKYKKPIIKLDKQSKRHITIVGLMVVTIVVMLVIAYYF